MRTSQITLLALVVLAPLIASCGDDTSGGSEALDLDGRRFWSTSVTEDELDRPLVDDTQIQLSFDDGQLGAAAGCNSMGGGYSVDGDVLVVGDMFMTEMGCDPARHEQDEFVAGFLGSEPTVAVAGDQLTLSTAEVTIELEDLSGDSLPLAGTTWTITGFIDGEAATSYNVAEPGHLVFEDSTMSGYDGCAAITGPVEISDGSTGGPVEGDGEFQFGPLSVEGDTTDCGDAEYRDLVHEVLTGQASYTIENAGPGASNLTITNTSGLAMTLTSP